MSIKQSRKELQRTRSQMGHKIKYLHKMRAWAKQLISNQKNTSKEAIAIILLPLTFGICAIWLGIGGYVEIPANYLKSPEKAVSVRNSGTLDENVCGLDVVNCDNIKRI